MEDLGHDIVSLKRSIFDLIVKTLCSVQPSLAHVYKSCQPEDRSNSCCFEILGFDVLLDHWLKPWLLEVNHSPSFTTDTPLDKKIKKQVIADALTLLNVSAKHKRRYLARKKSEIHQRAVLGKTVKVTKEEKEAMEMKAQRRRDKWEGKHLGGYTKIYPNGEPAYERYIKAAADLWEEWTGGNICRVKKEEPRQEQAKRPPRKLSKVVLCSIRPSKSPCIEASNSRSHTATDNLEIAQDVPIPPVFQRLSRARITPKREFAPIATLPNIYFADDAASGVIFVAPDRIYRQTEVAAKPRQYPIIYSSGKKRQMSGVADTSMKDRLLRKEVLQIPMKITSLCEKPQEAAQSSGSFLVPKTMDFSQFEAFTPSRRRDFFEGKRLKK